MMLSITTEVSPPPVCWYSLLRWCTTLLGRLSSSTLSGAPASGLKEKSELLIFGASFPCEKGKCVGQCSSCCKEMVSQQRAFFRTTPRLSTVPLKFNATNTFSTRPSPPPAEPDPRSCSGGMGAEGKWDPSSANGTHGMAVRVLGCHRSLVLRTSFVGSRLRTTPRCGAF